MIICQHRQNLRNYLQKKICETYEQAGFQRIATPIIEDIENLDKSEGGDNLNLNFQNNEERRKVKESNRKSESRQYCGYGTSAMTLHYL